MAERESRRETRQKAIDEFWKLPPDERKKRMADLEAVQRIERNGITVEDIHYAEEQAYFRGMQDGKEGTMQTCFAAICLSPHELHGFGRERCAKVLNDVYQRMLYALTAQEAIDEVYDTMGLKLNFRANVTEDAVTEVSK